MDAMTSPLLPATPPPATPPAGTAPTGTVEAGATEAELAAIIELARARGARTITIGSGRTPAATATADAIVTCWTRSGGSVRDMVTWPETAASWLRQASRFCRHDTDLWVMTGPATGWAQMTRRLLWSTSWRPDRTLATAAIGTAHALRLVGPQHVEGLAGAAADGTTWSVTRTHLRSPAAGEER